MKRPTSPLTGFLQRFPLSITALRFWRMRQWLTAALSGLAVGLLLGFVTVLIPNNDFGRDIPPTMWSYPVWIATSILSGMLIASYIRPAAPEAPANVKEPKDNASKWGMTGGFLAWFAVGCPVCNKIALVAFGYSGAITYFAPLQPWLATAALAITVLALVFRLSGQMECKLVAARAAEPERTNA
ncbi:hypothetical protein [Paeniglutamicibacter antarcticus]|uniref:Uncharacterized protein n=2 Tax=Paeniglutamicibacter antarcticus TaxID=494023 RepID=A0ABP9TJW8_9MICC